jgi:hypothetical protein
MSFVPRLSAVPWQALMVRARHGLSAPWLLSVALLALIALLIRPWGDYPLNDDWQYARAAKILSETGRIVIDTPVAPALVGQVLLAQPFIALFGFSHVTLRLVTMLAACLVLWAMDRLLGLAGVPRRTRRFTLVLLAINPLFVNLAFSFMTELYGYALALTGAVLWLSGRRTAEAQDRPAVIGIGFSLVAATLIGASFWIRQYCVLVYPALVAATAIELARDGRWHRIPRSVLAVTPGALVFTAIIGGYFLWAKSTDQLNGNFRGPLQNLNQFELLDWNLELGLHFIYLTAFLLPLLASWPCFRRPSARALGRCAVALAFGLASYSFIQLVATDDAGSLNLHRTFPFKSNIIHSAGVGPNTLTDIFFADPDRYWVLPRRLWRVVGGVLVAATALWGLPWLAIHRLERAFAARHEVALFGLVFAGASLAVVVQSYGTASFDRYSLPVLLGGALGLTILRAGDEAHGPSPRARLGSLLMFGAVAAPLAFFTVAGMHDYFRWNDARWRLAAHALAKGIPSTSLDGGYEINGWLSYDARNSPARSKGCIDRCHCDIPPEFAMIWTCHDDSYRIGMTLPPGRSMIAMEVPRFWLGKPRPVILSRR